MNFTPQLQELYEEKFNSWCLRVIDIEKEKFGYDLNVSDFNPLKEKIYEFIEQNIDTELETCYIEEEIFDFYTTFNIEKKICTGEGIYSWFLQSLIINHVFKRVPLQSFEELIKTRLENIQEIYLNEYNPVGNFGDLFQ